MSLDYLDYVSATEEQLKTLEYKLLNEGFDTILFTKTIGVEDRIIYKENFDSSKETYTRFQEDYLRYQDMFYNPKYYHEYSVYNAVTSMYCICPTKDRELIWKGYIDIIDIQDIDTSIKDYVRLVIVVLEEQDLLESLSNGPETK
ncbi:MAG: hypothetical protein HRU26_12690 [Psychroserpens sp.]|nr:hypothetical protein [Psychroserpens sp.]